jgi:hypothetical protein
MLKTGKQVKTVMALAAVLILTVILGCKSAQAQPATGQESGTVKRALAPLGLDDLPVGKPPAGWKVEATRPKGPLASWEIIEDVTAPSGEHVLSMTRPNHVSRGTFNLCWTNTLSFLDGEIQVRFKAVKGEVDQGGGVIWRVQDKNNYYIARFNPLEDNFRIYCVRDGARKKLASVRVKLPAGKWHTLKIVQRGNRFEGYLNGRKLLNGKNNLFKKSGGVGLWTKADAVTSFDDFSVRPFAGKGDK